jgi:hypothetical protein
MGIRGELFSSRIGCEGRTYFFNVKENRLGDMFLTVVESKPSESEGFERRSVVIFREDMPEFLKAFQGALDFMGKDVAGKKTLDYAPADKKPPKKPSSPSGFAGENDPKNPPKAAAGAAGGAAPKRRIVVKRKPSAPKS